MNLENAVEPQKSTKGSKYRIFALPGGINQQVRLVESGALGFTQKCFMPMDSALADIDRLSNMKSLVHLLSAEGRLHEMDNRPADAARSYTDAIRFGNEMSRGGLIVTHLVGIACEAIGCHALAQVLPKLSPKESRIVLSELEKIDAGRFAWAEVLQNEQYFMRYQLKTRWNPIMRVIGWWETRPAIQNAETKHRIVIAHERLLIGELALRCFQSEQGHPPARLGDVVTNYFSKVPLDPFTGQPMVYRQQGHKLAAL